MGKLIAIVTESAVNQAFIEILRKGDSFHSTNQECKPDAGVKDPDFGPPQRAAR
jgi:hypothetical protein